MNLALAELTCHPHVARFELLFTVRREPREIDACANNDDHCFVINNAMDEILYIYLGLHSVLKNHCGIPVVDEFYI